MGIELMSRGAMVVADGGQPPVEGRHSPRWFGPDTVARGAFGERREVEGDQPGVGGEGGCMVSGTPGREVLPVGEVGADGIGGAGGGDVVRSAAEESGGLCRELGWGGGRVSGGSDVLSIV